MQNNFEDLIEIIPGIYYNKKNGKPFSTRKPGGGYYPKPRPLCSQDKDGYMKISNEGKGILWHRAVYEYFYGEIPKGKVIDHKDNDTKNNLISNLQLSDIAANVQKRKMQKNSTTGLAGVTLRACGRYYAQLQVNKKQLHLGSYETKEEAYAAYLAAKRVLHGKESIAPLEHGK
jgi:hypothetical protein